MKKKILTLRQTNSLHTSTNLFHFIRSSGLGLNNGQFLSGFPHQNPLFISLLSHPKVPDLIIRIELDDICRLITGIGGSNPAEVMDVRVLCYVSSGLCDEPITPSDKFYRLCV
jgi:hypothetical protein